MLRNLNKPLSCQVFYGGLGGQGKRIDMVIKTPKYKMKVNIRDTQGGDGYPTRIMGISTTYRVIMLDDYK